jgi:hypothetical protein
MGLDMMKFSLNHPFRFNNWFSCFLLGFMKLLVTLLLEIANALFMLQLNDIVVLVYSYIKLIAIASIDTVIYKGLTGDPFMQILASKPES